MGFLDNIGKTLGQGLDRAKFEAEKFQKLTRLQGELNDLRRQSDGRRIELGDRALELYKAGQIQSATLGEIIRSIEALRASITLKEEELKLAQNDNFVEPYQSPSPTPSQAQSVPIQVDPAASRPATPAPEAGKKTCPSCQFQMPSSAMFCPSCGTRVGL